MLKRMTVIARRDGLSRGQFRARRRSRHAELVKKLPGVRRNVQNIFLDDALALSLWNLASRREQFCRMAHLT